MASPGASRAVKHMRILLVHCRYQQRGGEDSVFDAEADQLESAGHQIHRCEFHNDELRADSLSEKLALASETIWGRRSAKVLQDSIKIFTPEVVHFHNTFPSLSPSAYYCCYRAGVPVVQTLHNYRVLCANAMFLRAGSVCEDCMQGAYYNGVVHSCYRRSRSASATVVGMQYAHRMLGTYTRKVNRFIALTEFAKSRFVLGGIPADTITVKPNSLRSIPDVGRGQGGYALYVGRLSAEKGLRTLVKAWCSLRDVPLKIVGDGPLFGELNEFVKENELNVELTGPKDSSDVAHLMSNASILVVPSEWYEGFPMTIVEAYSVGLPVVASNIGSLGEVVIKGETGRLFPPKDAEKLAQVITEIWHDTDELAACRAAARSRFMKNYTAERNVAALEAIYRTVIERGSAF